MSELRELSGTSDADALLTPLSGAPIDEPSAWKVADFKTPADYTIELGAAHLRDIARAIQQIQTAGLSLDDLQCEHFELPSLEPVIRQIREEIKDGCGFVLLRRLPVEDYSKDELGMIFWGIGTHLRRGLSQSVLGERLGHVKDFSREDPRARLPQQAGAVAAHRQRRPGRVGVPAEREVRGRVAAHQRHHGS